MAFEARDILDSLLEQKDGYESVKFDSKTVKKYQYNDCVSGSCWKKNLQKIHSHQDVQQFNVNRFSNLRHQFSKTPVGGHYYEFCFAGLVCERLYWNVNWLKHCKRVGTTTKSKLISRSEFKKYASSIFKLLRLELKLPKLICDTIVSFLMFEQYRGSICQLNETDAPWNLNELCQQHNPPIRKMEGVPLYFELVDKIFPETRNNWMHQNFHIFTTNCEGTLIWDEHNPKICESNCYDENNFNFWLPITCFEEQEFCGDYGHVKMEVKIYNSKSISALLFFSPKLEGNDQELVAFTDICIFDHKNRLLLRRKEKDCRIFAEDPCWHAISFESDSLPENVLSKSVFEEKCIDMTKNYFGIQFLKMSRNVRLYSKYKSVFVNRGGFFQFYK